MKLNVLKFWIVILTICTSNAYAFNENQDYSMDKQYVVKEDFLYFDDEGQIDSRIGEFDFLFNEGVDDKGNDLLKLSITQIYKQSTTEQMLTSLPTIFLVPGGGFTAVLPSDFINVDNCTGKSLANLLADQGYNVFVLTYQVATGVEKLLLDLSLAHVCNTVVTDSVKYIQQKTSYKSFWSLRKVITDKTSSMDSLIANNIDINNMIMIGHSAGGFLTLYSLFLNQSEIPSSICSLSYNACNIPSNWRTQYWPLPKMKGYVAMSGATFSDNIFLNDTSILGNNGPNLLLMHGTCDELVNQYDDYVSSKCKIGGVSSLNVGYTKNSSNPASKFNKVYGSGFIFQQLYTKMKKIRYEQVCDGGHSINNISINCPFSTQSTNAAVLFGQWNTCDLDNPTGLISTQHLLFNCLNDFIQRTLFSNPGPLLYELKSTLPELSSQKCLTDDRGDVTPVTGINNIGCSLTLEGGIGATLYAWYIYNISSPPQIISIAPSLDVSLIPSGTWYVAGAAANACDIEYFIFQVEFNSCSSSRVLPDEVIIKYYDRYFLLDIKEEGKGVLLLSDLSGRVISEIEYSAKNGENKIYLEELSTRLHSGIYILNYSNNKVSASTRFFTNGN
ncbi:MAG: S9 family peptidase [Chitinophagales bacterium]|nr:S9 family peptidase [Chitinophagales bacterium]